jgi:RHS repeat-associated protein
LLSETLGAQPGTPTYFAAYDGNGNVSALVNAADGTLAARYDYTAFGERALTAGPAALLNPFRFSTKYEDAESGLLYYGFRYYNPNTGRWPSRDPIEEQGGNNLYAMLNNNPVNNLDYLGLDFIAVGKRGAKAALNLRSHMSIEFYEQNSCGAPKGLKFKAGDLTTHSSLQGAVRKDQYELIPELWSYRQTRSLAGQSFGVPVGVSFILNSSTAEELVVIYSDSKDVKDAATKWKSIVSAATSYVYAEHGAKGSAVANWPNSKYQFPPGNNSNTFIHEMAAVIGASAAVFTDTPGATRATPVTGAGLAPVYVP